MKEDLLMEILNLSPAERLRLAQDIWASVYQLPDTDQLSKEQKEELVKRLKNLEDNPNRGVPWKEVIFKLHTRS